jgi:penicillin amidase
MPTPKTVDLAIEGLEQPAEIVIDRWGIPHIRANTRHDVFFAQGFAAARERLWQLDMWRKRGLGRLAADFGPGFLAQDRAARLFLYRGDMAAEWAAYGIPDAQPVTAAFVAGINAWIDRCEAQPSLLPPEYEATGTHPEPFTPEDVLRIRSHGLVRNVLSEVQRAIVMAKAGLETDLARRSVEPPWDIVVPEGLDAAAIPPTVLDTFKLATARLDFNHARMTATLEDAWKWTRVDDLGDVYLQGSNNWAVAPGRTETGRPVLASDPHRAHGLPSLRWIVHLTGPGIDAIGAGEPAVPGISIGHNLHCAFSLTIFPMDQEDLYVYETDPENPNRYRYGEGWEEMRVVEERIVVRGHPDQAVTLKFTRHGPVICEDVEGRKAYAVRSVWFEPGASAYLTSLAYMQATSLAEYEKALEGWATPSVNHVYADTEGNIAWYAAGRAPVRPNWDGLLPVPGDGRYEWRGFHAFSELPRSVNPEKGFFATANEMNLPDGYPYTEKKLGFEWAERSRTTRIHEVLAAQEKHSLADSMALQTDDFSIPARRLKALLAPLSGEGDTADALAMLAEWDGRLSRDSAAAALFELWWSKQLKPTLLDLISSDPDVRPLLVPGDVETLLAMLEAPDPRIAHRDALLLSTLGAAMVDARLRLGQDRGAWRWGALHHGFFEHPLYEILGEMPNVGPHEKGGSGSTPMAAGYRLSDFRVTNGSSFRMVADVGNWDASVCINAPGQSGDPRSPHYGDLAPKWAAGEYVPMVFSRAAVDQAAETILRLKPAEPA